MSEVTGRAFDVGIFRRLLRYAGPYKGLFAFTASLTIILGVSAIIRPTIIRITVDEHIKRYDYQGLLEMSMLLIGVLIAESIFQYLQSYYSSVLGQNVIRDIRQKISKKILQFRLTYFDRTPIGQLVTRVVSDIETIADVFSQGIIVILGDIFKLVVVISYMFYVNWRLTLIVLIPIPVLLVATYIFKRVIKAAFQQVRTQVSVLNSFVQEHIVGMSVVQVFNREREEQKKFETINEKHKQAHIKTVWAYSVYLPVVEMLSASSIGLMVWWGCQDALKGLTTLGVLFEFILYIHMLYRPIRQLADRFNVLQMGMVSSERVFKILDTDSTISDEGTSNAEGLVGEIEFKNVWFAYEDENWVIRDVSFKVSAGETLALVGATGAGKSTIINLLGRYYEFQKGEILIDGKDIRSYDLDSLRKQMAVVLQDVFLFSDNIYNNITLNDESISEEAVVDASKRVGAHGFIEKLPEAYRFDVRERGSMLSVGQRQLISFIRAYVNNPRILILDEATSSIDTESELLIQRATEVLTEGRTSIIVAHRLSTIRNATKILVFDSGKIVEMGNHDELLAKQGRYKELYEIQFAKEELTS